jgi:D-3-phosphoglycerate dehydrogenase / 2-oxoglutarate reductase
LSVCLSTSLYKTSRFAIGKSPRLTVIRALSDASDNDGEDSRGKWKTYGDVEHYKPGRFVIKTFNKISNVGLGRFTKDLYDVRTGDDSVIEPHAVLLRSHKLQESEIDVSVRAIARCGAGTNNIPVARMTELGIPVFNTPGANANAVKELVICGMLLGRRRIIDGINHMRDLGKQGIARERVEKDKAKFGGRELQGKTLAVIGLGHIGSLTARDAKNLGMKIKGYDPGLSVHAALKLPRSIQLADSIASAVTNADYISLNIPYIKGNQGTHGIINKDIIANFKSDAVLLNFARGELVDSEALKDFLDKGTGRYVSDFPDDVLWDHKNAVILPHLGASTEEAEDAAASMAADTIRDFLETGNISNSVNFPSTKLEDSPEGTVRITVVNKNVPGCLAAITEAIASENYNIVQQINQSRGEIAYNVMDVDKSAHDDVVSFKHVQEKITMLPGVLSSRVLYGVPGTGYARNIDGDYIK